jgi:hypothetical protein
MQQHVEIRVRGTLDASWSDWLEGLSISHVEPDETVLRGTVADSTALYGLLSKLRDLGLTLVSVSSRDASMSKEDG